jgi:hypothetical protein
MRSRSKTIPHGVRWITDLALLSHSFIPPAVGLYIFFLPSCLLDWSKRGGKIKRDEFSLQLLMHKFPQSLSEYLEHVTRARNEPKGVV